MTLQSTDKGLVVSQLDPSGIAAESGMREGDVIEKIDGKAVTSATQLKSALNRTDGKPSLVIVNREGRSIFLTLASR
jgi:serine protease Do